MKRLLGLGLCACLLLTACGGTVKSSGDIQPVGYVEADITPADAGALHVFYFDGTLYGYNDTFATGWQSGDLGDTWQERNAPGSASGYYSHASMSSDDGTLYLASQITTKIQTCSTDGTQGTLVLEEVQALVDKKYDTFCMALQALPGRRIFARYSYTNATTGGFDEITGIFNVDTGETLHTFDGLYFGSTGADEDTLYLIGYNGEVAAYSLKSYQPVEDKSTPVPANEAIGQGDVPTASAEQSLILATPVGIYTTADEAPLIDGMDASFGVPGTALTSLATGDDGTLFVAYTFDGAAKLVRLTPGTPEQPTDVLRVWSMHDNATLRLAAANLRQQNPGLRVVLETGVQDMYSPDTSDAILMLNTELIAGKGPDVLVLDGAQMQSYAARGALVDISSLVNTSDMFPTLRDAFVEEDGSVYALPMDFTMTLLASSTGGTDADLASLVARAKAGLHPDESYASASAFDPLEPDERTEIWFATFDEAFDLLWNTSAPLVVQGTQLNTCATKDMLEALTALNEVYAFTQRTFGDYSHSFIWNLEAGTLSAIYKGASLAYLSNRAHTGALEADSYYAMLSLKHNESFPAQNTAYSLFPSLSPGAWQPVTLVSINDTSSQKELAAEFIQMMLSPEVQGKTTGAALPVTYAGAAAQQAYFAEVYSTNWSTITPELNYISLVEGLGAPNLVSTELAEMVRPIALRYCEGGLTLEDAVQQIEQATSTYLAERQV